MQYDINIEAARISFLWSGKINNNKYFSGKEILFSNKKKIIEQAKITYSPLGKPFKEEVWTIKYQGEE